MLDRLNFRLGEIIGLIHALEKRYYENKTQLRYNFGSVYMYHPFLLRWNLIFDLDRQKVWKKCNNHFRNLLIMTNILVRNNTELQWRQD